MCLKTCPELTYVNYLTNKCVKSCPNSFYADRVNNVCRNTTNPCPTDFVSDKTTGLCICANGYYNHLIKKC